MPAALAEAPRATPSLLDQVSPDRIAAVPRPDAGETVRRHVDPQSDQGRRRQSRHQEAGLSACPATFLRDRTFGGGSRSVNDQSVVGSFELCDDDALSALSPRASSQCAESAGLAAGTATADVHAAQGEHWRRLLENGSSTSLRLYGALGDESDCMFWDGLVGEDFNALELKTLIESAKERGVQSSSPLQSHRAGFATDEGYLVGSF